MVTLTELQYKLGIFQKLISKGCNPDYGLPWLSQVCDKYKAFYEDARVYMKANKINKSSTYLCLTQVVTCIQNLEKIFSTESQHQVALTALRQHFIDRLLWCITKLNTSLAGIDKLVENEFYNNFLEVLDDALFLIEPYTEYNNGNVSKCDEFYSQAIDASRQLRALVEILLSQVLGYAIVSNETDKRALVAFSGKVLQEAIAFEMECLKMQGNENMIQLQATILESAFYQLENCVGETLVRLVYDIFLGFNKFSIENLRRIIDSGIEEEEISKKIVEFNFNVEKTTQVGIFAVAFTPTPLIQATIRNSLASFESLSPLLIPAIQKKSLSLNTKVFCAQESKSSELTIKILCEHFEQEINNFKVAIEQIIDNAAFCRGFLEMFEDFVDKFSDSTEKSHLEDILFKATILKDHLKKNNSCDKQTFKMFETNLEECKEITLFFGRIDSTKILLRLKVFRTMLNKLEKEFKAERKDSGCEMDDEFIELSAEDISKSYKTFQTYGIEPSPSNILYSDMPKKESQAPPPTVVNQTVVIERSSKTRCFIRKPSIRTKMFKKKANIKAKEMIIAHFTVQTMEVLYPKQSLNSSDPSNITNILLQGPLISDEENITMETKSISNGLEDSFLSLDITDILEELSDSDRETTIL